MTRAYSFYSIFRRRDGRARQRSRVSGSINGVLEETPEQRAREYAFGPHRIRRGVEVFFSTRLTYAMVNVRPIVEHHVLVVPRRCVARFADMTHEEVCDLWLSAQCIGARLEVYGQARGVTGLQFVLQDGSGSGQTVPHVHVHVVPRAPGDFEPNDLVYEALERSPLRRLSPDAATQRNRSDEDMTVEREELRRLFPEREHQVL
ncbi:hypothetical protein CDCA_CDCA20G4832 [Cyanidium caldarium]|uniref:HIT domain-containing protein n=1 Tax=Cyanidium caldarium TaxID=2771 RepID=A0AAV9J2M6_CYACA|nr:hypothetical protein CDCA_CDCA20G4832 [Cyanidium caldarium]